MEICSSGLLKIKNNRNRVDLSRDLGDSFLMHIEVFPELRALSRREYVIFSIKE